MHVLPMGPGKQKACVITVLLVAALGLSACENRCADVAEEDSRGARSPDMVLDLLAEAHEKRDFQLYETLMRESYHFVLDTIRPDTIGPEPLQLSRAEDLTSTRNMFEEPCVQAIAIALNKVEDWAPCWSDSAVGLCCVLDPDVKITLEEDPGFVPTTWYDIKWYFLGSHETEKRSHDGAVFSVHDSRVTLLIREDGNEPACWSIVRIEEIADEQ